MGNVTEVSSSGCNGKIAGKEHLLKATNIPMSPFEAWRQIWLVFRICHRLATIPMSSFDPKSTPDLGGKGRLGGRNGTNQYTTRQTDRQTDAAMPIGRLCYSIGALKIRLRPQYTVLTCL